MSLLLRFSSFVNKRFLLFPLTAETNVPAFLPSHVLLLNEPIEIDNDRGEFHGRKNRRQSRVEFLNEDHR